MPLCSEQILLGLAAGGSKALAEKVFRGGKGSEEAVHGHTDFYLVTGSAIESGPGLVEYLAVLLQCSWSVGIPSRVEPRALGVVPTNTSRASHSSRGGPWSGAAGRGENEFFLLFTI